MQPKHVEIPLAELLTQLLNFKKVPKSQGIIFSLINASLKIDSLYVKFTMLKQKFWGRKHHWFIRDSMMSAGYIHFDAL